MSESTVMVKGLSAETDMKAISELFSEIGPVKRADVIRDPKTFVSRGFAFGGGTGA